MAHIVKPAKATNAAMQQAMFEVAWVVLAGFFAYRIYHANKGVY